MKKLLCFILVITMLLSLAACVKKETPQVDENENTEVDDKVPDNTDETQDESEKTAEEDLAKKESDYAAAVALYESGSYKDARAAFYRLGDFKDSVKYYLSIDARPCTTVYQSQNFTTLTTRSYDENGNLLSEYIDFGSHDVIEEKREYTYDEKGRILTSYRGDNFGSGIETYTYTDSGYTMIRDVVGGNGLTERYEQFFNDKDLCVKEIYRREDGSGFFIEYEYDGDGNFLKSYSADLSGNFISLYVNEYDEHGNVISINKNNYGNVDTYSRTYDEHGNITSDKHIFPDGTEEIYEWGYRYDEFGNIIYEVIRGESGKTAEETVFDNIQADGTGFSYDKKTVNTTYTSKDGSVMCSEQMVYDSSERLLYSFRDDGETQITEEYTYDVFGNWIKVTFEQKVLDSQKTVRTSTTYTYDEDGNLIRYESTGDDGNVFTEEYSDFVYFVKEKVEVIKEPDESIEITLGGKTFRSDVTELDLCDCELSDITPLQQCTNLTVLGLSCNHISDISALGGLTNLAELNLSCNYISDISALRSLTNLTKLNLEYGVISDISPLSDLKNLTELNLSHNIIPDISALSGLTNLTTLLLTGNEITNISSLAGLTNLTSLSVSYNKITDIEALSGLTSLTGLAANYNNINDISALGELKNLTHLWLDGNEISDISVLGGLTNLSYLTLYYNCISDFSPIDFIEIDGIQFQK